jgi:hypothetical protein
MAKKPGEVSIVRRDRTLRLTVTSDIYERLERLAVLVGLPPATLATVAVGFYISNQERALGATERMMDKMAEQIGGDTMIEVQKQLSLLTKAPE